MKYFWTEEERKKHRTTCCIEFRQGSCGEAAEAWKDNSLNIYAELFDDLGMYKIIKEAVPEFDYYGITEITRPRWEKIRSALASEGGELSEAAAELSPWAEENFRTEEVFTIWGI